MKQCPVCDQELQEGYGFCHVCGTPVGVGAQGQQRGPSTTSLVEVVDKLKGFSAMTRDLGSSAQHAFDELLGSPIAIQRQIAYALLSGLAFACMMPPAEGFLEWFELWLVLSVLLLVPVSYWTTGVFPFSGTVNRILGPELSLRRRMIFSAILTLILAPSLSSLVAPEVGPGLVPAEAVSADLVLLGNIFLYPLSLLGSYLTSYYLMGFVTSWRTVPGCEFSISTGDLAERATSISEQIRQSMAQRKIPGFQLTRVEMGKLRHFTAGASSGSIGEQLSFISGKARMVVFVQDFGSNLFIRAAGFYDASGRRLWLFFGFWVASFDRLILRWFATSPLDETRQWLGTLSPATRNQILLRPEEGGAISRALRLTEGVSEYSWNELFALAGTVQESVAQALEGATEDRGEMKRIRSQLDRQARFEKMTSGSSKKTGR